MPAAVRSNAMIIAALALLLPGCVVYPRQTERYDAECDITYNKLVLDSSEMRNACAQRGANDPTGAACLGGVLALGPISYAASLAVIMAGNTAYWLEKEARCMRKPGPATVQAPASGVVESSAQ